MQLVQLDSSPGQTFKVTLLVNGANLTLALTLNYNSMAGYWSMDIADAQGNPLLFGIPLVTGSFPAANLLQPYGYLGIGSAFIINKSGDPGDYAGTTNLGGTYELIWSDN